MKISFECDCIILQNSLLMFCKEFVSHHKDCDFIVSDKKLNTHKPLFLIGSHICVPFTKQNLINALEEFYSVTLNRQNSSKSMDFEARLDLILANFKKELMGLIRD
ncbi:ornithine carbamoyltransferase [Campylobacter mucosalis]|uniref:ornithine carbamoyltransferase n=1 Tax=Campylobacter mucosalis TaxID=202 RepID=UPI0014702170|nr:ornithine carbamoyltransferase [Campylobacter mucosalis]